MAEELVLIEQYVDQPMVGLVGCFIDPLAQLLKVALIVGPIADSQTCFDHLVFFMTTSSDEVDSFTCLQNL